MRPILVPLILAAAGALTLSACGDDAGSTPPQMSDSQIVYSFIGPSVAPQYHDEYTLTIADGQGTLRRGTYGVVDGTTEPASTRTEPVDEATWDQLANRLNTLPDTEGEAGCAGGSTFGVTVTTGSRTVHRSSGYACGSRFDQVADPYLAFIAPVSERFGL
ncbi:hypothetical protein [Gordonia sp. VNK21]|uniref:hypothetical protein n=1 Tax=Gordonia sp. VNK21 TaxID=3382483 RepID=UPI0038D410EA